MRFVGILVLLSLVWLHSESSAQEYQPLTIGNQWTYQGSLGAQDGKRVSRTFRLWGTDVSVMHYENTTENDGLENYWTADVQGTVHLWGFYRSVEGLGFLYRPAIEVVQGPLYVGKEWTQHFESYSLPDTIPGGSFIVVYHVYEETDLTVPAGTFHVFGIGSSIRSPLPGGFPQATALTGEHRALQDGSPTDWWANHVGEVQYLGDQMFQLVTFEPPTPVRLITWGVIKALYR